MLKSSLIRRASFGSRLRGGVVLPLAGVAVLAAGSVSDALAKSAPYEVIYNFGSKANDGTYPYANLMKDKSGNLYGTTSQGGSSGAGTVFRITTAGTETVLYSFAGGNDGAGPGFGSLIEDKSGNLYGTTQFGGPANSGTVFMLAPDGTETTLFSFAGTGGGTDGGQPAAGLIADDKGNLYGTTQSGGANTCAPYTGCGEVFELVKGNSGAWTEKVLWSFNGNDGGYPDSGLLRIGGNLYGANSYFGADGWGSVFELVKGKKGAWNEQVLYSFTGGTDGKEPLGDLAKDSAGNLYGQTEGPGGGANGDGDLFELAPDGTFTVLHSFQGGSDGAFPQTGMWMSKTGDLYGMTLEGGGVGNFGDGTIFRLRPDGTEKVRHAFAGSPNDGVDPQGFGPLTDIGGYLYGTALGGANDAGIVFRIKE